MEFKNSEIAKKFEMVHDKDQVITTLATEKREAADGVAALAKAPAYSGPLSEVADPAILQNMIARKSNLVRTKVQSAGGGTSGDNKPK